MNHDIGSALDGLQGNEVVVPDQRSDTANGCQPFEQQLWRCRRNGGVLLCVCDQPFE